MKKKYLILMLMVALLVFSDSLFAASVTIVNGDFEIGADNDAPPFGWTDNTPTSFWLGVAGESDNPTLDEAAMAPGGLGNFFLTTGRQSAGVDSQPVDGQLVQRVDLSALAAGIDAGTQILNIDFIYASDDSRDTGTFSLHFFSSTDGSGTELGSGYSVALDAGSGYDFSGWQEMTVGGLVPVSARSVILQIDTTRTGGSATNIWIDNLSLRDAAYNPSPAVGATSVDTEAILSWDSPETYTGATYDVYFGTTEPNFNEPAPYGLTLIGTAGQSDTTAVPVPSPMATDTTYYWVVNTYEPNDVPVLHQGTAWSFTTIPSTPQINPQPQSTYFKAGDAEVTLTLKATSTFPPLSYQWYKDDAIISDGAKYSGTQTDTLVVLNPDANDEASYYCKVTGDNGGITDSDTAVIKESRMVAWYQFEQNVNDSAGINDANDVVGGLAYTDTDVVITSDGQAYAADPNGVAYAVLSTEAYPKVGFGNALQEGSIAFWMKLNTTETATQSIIGTFNDGSTQGIQLQSYYNGITRFYMRDNAGDAIECRSDDENIDDSQWHFIVLTYQLGQGGSTARIYVDGEPSGDEATNTSAMDQLGEWQYPMMLLARNNRGVFGEPCLGSIDDLKIYNYMLTVEEIAQSFYDVTGQQSCVLEYANTFDVTGPDSVPDCVIDLYDFAEMAAAWLDSGLYPILP